mgnify:CR=1 FL=1
MNQALHTKKVYEKQGILPFETNPQNRQWEGKIQIKNQFWIKIHEQTCSAIIHNEYPGPQADEK